MKVAGAKLSDYEEYVYSLMEKYPVTSASGCINSKGLRPAGHGASDLHDYKIVQYQYVFDNADKILSQAGSGSGSGSK